MKFLLFSILAAVAAAGSTSEDEVNEFDVKSAIDCNGDVIRMECELDIDEISRNLLQDLRGQLRGHRDLKSDDSPEFDLNFDNCDFSINDMHAETYEFTLIQDELAKHGDVYEVIRTWKIEFITLEGKVVSGEMAGKSDCLWTDPEPDEGEAIEECSYDGFGVSWNDC